MNPDRRTYLKAAGVATGGVIGISGCLGSSDSDGSTGTLSTSVTDQPTDIEDFDSLVITIVGMWLGPSNGDDGDDNGADDADNETDDDTDDESESSGREYHEYDEPQEADLVQLQDGSAQLVDERDIETGEYQFLQIDVDGVDATLADGTAATVETPGEAPLTFNRSFEIREDTRTSFTADFTPVKRGQSGGYGLQPVPTGITVEYDDDT